MEGKEVFIKNIDDLTHEQWLGAARAFSSGNNDAYMSFATVGCIYVGSGSHIMGYATPIFDVLGEITEKISGKNDTVALNIIHTFLEEHYT